jgi:hypothetical protein
MGKLRKTQGVAAAASERQIWTVEAFAKVRRQVATLPPDIAALYRALTEDLVDKGPVQSDWPNYGKLENQKGDVYHCHLKNGRPTWVAVWKVKNKRIRLMEVTYAGTHENAPY